MFSEGTFEFLSDLAANNDRTWFQARRNWYEELVREPALDYIRDIGARLGELSPHLRADDRKQGGSLMRIHRDVRFSRDKSPYKTNIGIQFRHASGTDVHAPGCYVHLSPEECFIGVGSWTPDRDALHAYRRAISEHPAQWTALKASFDPAQWQFNDHGDRLKRPPRGFRADDPMLDDLKRKSFILTHPLTPADATAPDFADYSLARFQESREWLAFLTQALGLPF